MNLDCLELNTKILKGFGKDYLINESYYNVEPTVDKNLTFLYDKNDCNIHINSCYDVDKEADGVLDNIDFSKDHLYLVYGIGLGYHIKEIIRRASERSRIFVIEKDKDILNTYIRNKNLLELDDKRVVLFFGDEQDIIGDFNSHIFSFDIMPLILNITPVVMPAYYVIYGESLNSLNKRIMDLFRHAMFNLGNDIDDTVIGLRQNFDNIKELIKSPSIEILKDKYKDKPAIIVGAGPSLDKNIKYLKEAEGKALILATDAVISTLNRYNIIPDAVFTIERVKETYDAFYKNNILNEKTVFIGPPVVSPLIFNKLKNNKKLVCLKKGEKINEWINDSILRENRLLNMGTSCSHVALGFSQYVGADPIIFIGQDLAYTKDGITHSNDVEIKKKVEDNKELVYVKGIDGEMLSTDYAYKNFLTFLEIQIASDDLSRKYIDATEGGAFKNGTEIKTLIETIEKYCNENIPRLYDALPEMGLLDMKKVELAEKELSLLLKDFNNLHQESKRQFKELEKIEKQVLEQNIDIKAIKKVIKNKERVEKPILNNDILRTFFQGLLMNCKMKEIELGNGKDIDTITKKIQVYKSFMENMTIGTEYCYKNTKEIIYNINNDEDTQYGK